MVKVPPIPLELLIHSVQYSAYNPDDPFGESWSDPVTLERVRVEPSTKLVKNASGEQVVSAATLFVDTENSKPSPLPAFSEKSKIIFAGREMYFVLVDPLFAYDPVTPHHYEIALV